MQGHAAEELDEEEMKALQRQREDENAEVEEENAGHRTQEGAGRKRKVPVRSVAGSGCLQLPDAQGGPKDGHKRTRLSEHVSRSTRIKWTPDVQQEQTTAAKQATAVRRAKEQARAKQARAEQAHAEIVKKNMALATELAAAHGKIAQQEQTAKEQARAEQAHAEISEKNTALAMELAAVRDKIAQQEQTAAAEQARAVREAKEQAHAEQTTAVRKAKEQARAEQAHVEIVEKNTALETELAAVRDKIAQQEQTAAA
jgi:hypothetical protein